MILEKLTKLSHMVFGEMPITRKTGPAKIGHICTQNWTSFLNFNLQYLLKYKCYDNDSFMPYSPINKKGTKLYRT